MGRGHVWSLRRRYFQILNSTSWERWYSDGHLLVPTVAAVRVPPQASGTNVVGDPDRAASGSAKQLLAILVNSTGLAERALSVPSRSTLS